MALSLADKPRQDYNFDKTPAMTPRVFTHLSICTNIEWLLASIDHQVD